MSTEARIMRNGRPIPVVAFFGTKGGVGKTTVARQFAELVTMAGTDGAGESHNVLIVDVDVHNRGMTVLLGATVANTCKFIHDYIASQRVSDVDALNVSHAVEGARPGSGGLFFIPSSQPESDEVFTRSAQIGAPRLREILHEVITAAVQRYECDCVVIDCGPIIDPYTAAGASLSDRAFIIGQNEPISFQNVRFYPARIREFFPDFTSAKMKLIINKVHVWELLKDRAQQSEVFHAIPFTMEIVDISEGLERGKEMGTLMFRDHIAQIVEKTLRSDHPELVPSRESLLAGEWELLVQNADRLRSAPRIRFLGLLRLLLPLGLLAALGGATLFYSGSTRRHAEENRLCGEELKGILAARTDPAFKDVLDQLGPLDLSDKRMLDYAITQSKAAGLTQIPVAKPLPATRENTGIMVLLAGLVAAAVGLTAWMSRRRYMAALDGLRKNGVSWLMKEIAGRSSARKTFDELLKMAKNCT